jgi:hypothetical protein
MGSHLSKLKMSCVCNETGNCVAKHGDIGERSLRVRLKCRMQRQGCFDSVSLHSLSGFIAGSDCNFSIRISKHPGQDGIRGGSLLSMVCRIADTPEASE